MSTNPIKPLVPPNEESSTKQTIDALPFPITGSCLCGSLTYKLTSQPFNFVICHCQNCSKASGSGMQYNGFFHKSALHLDSPSNSTLKTYHDTKSDSGTIVERNFCGSCGSHLFTTNPTVPDLVIVMLGCVDGKVVDLGPREEFYCKRMWGWMKDRGVNEESKKFETMS